ncbi:MAG TPA: DUF262 domain-containing HNH endonuclease family protein [Bacteroidales bacterium]|nr:DUF262 domain-containing HNH endonuclease family protein [Bacteroidales bacterium]
MSSTKVSDFFNRRFFEIPKYQRGFAWEVNNVRDLFDDLNEAIESGTSHYIGTIVLSKCKDDDSIYYVVDGQQRITTLTLILNSIIKNLSSNDKYYYERFYIRESNHYRLVPMNRDSQFFNDLINGIKNKPENKSQRYLLEAYTEIEARVSMLNNKLEFLRAIEQLEIMVFIENSEGDAIRIFQTVNDRGKLLSNMEKVKSLLIYFSNRYLDKKLDDSINNSFSDIFELYDDIKHLGEEYSINLISNVNFTEDSLLRYHFVTFNNGDYDPTAEHVLRNLKLVLSDLRTKHMTADNVLFKSEVEKYITQYVSSLFNFFQCCKSVIERVTNNVKYYKLFCILNLSARLYPLVIKLESKGILDNALPSDQNYTFFDLIELIDVRVYKTRGTDPKRNIADFVYEIQFKNEIEIENWMRWFNAAWMPKDLFRSNLLGNMYGNAQLMRGVFIEYCEKIIKKSYSLNDLMKFMESEPAIEHILAQTPNFSPVALGFNDNEDFLSYEHKFGNLTILEKKLNSACQNLVPLSKIPFYDKSLFIMTKNLSSEIASKNKFVKDDLQKRTTVLADFCIERYWC